MTEAKPRVHATPAGVTLCALDDIADGAARGFVLETHAGRFHGFVLRRGAVATGYVDSCPHTGAVLARSLDDYLAADGRYLACAWHGALFEPDDGRCVAGPCVGARLTPWPIAVVDGAIVTA